MRLGREEKDAVDSQKVKKGRQPISWVQRKTVSIRAVVGKMSVDEIECPKCHHHKAFTYDNSLRKKCTRCKHVF